MKYIKPPSRKIAKSYGPIPERKRPESLVIRIVVLVFLLIVLLIMNK